MNQLYDLETFAKKLKDKGYDGYFQTEAAYSGKLIESISEYLKAYQNDKGIPNKNPSILLSTYLQWNGDDKPRVKCNLYIKHENGTFDVQKMDISRTDRYGQLLKKSQLTNLSIATIPKVKEAISQVTEDPKQQLSSRKRGFRM
ncbi:hypothetical protein [Flavobacterium sp. 7A]|uniref:hypothetical protein n=1 Tax=Flavobacterium sp. 7A TaxID=2940571 RepID=UPI002227836F|nr:hypothetical protein [Flavobacterium sp. 7A]MCW2120650.1 hypothetical protein [Flavobacterium sp. 7A]